jgi:hypothetical protein
MEILSLYQKKPEKRREIGNFRILSKAPKNRAKCETNNALQES